MSQLDLWNEFIAKRELGLAKLNYGTKIESYRIVMLNTQGKTIYDSTAYLYSDTPSQIFDPGTPSDVDRSQTKDILKQILDSGYLKLLSLNVSPKYFDRWNSKLVIIELSTEIDSHETAEPWISEFIINLKPQIEMINTQNGTRIAIVWLKIQDAQGYLLVDYLIDIDLGTQTFWVAEDFHGGWYSEPAPVVSPYPTIDTTAIPSPSPIPVGITVSFTD